MAAAANALRKTIVETPTDMIGNPTGQSASVAGSAKFPCMYGTFKSLYKHRVGIHSSFHGLRKPLRGAPPS